jgi:phosphoribosylformylglycinamidine synthase single chain form
MTDTVRQLYLRVSDDFEYCFNIAANAPLAPADIEKLRQLLGDGFVSTSVADTPYLAGDRVAEVGPRLNFATAWSSNLVSICQAIGLAQVTRVERSRRLRVPAGEAPQGFAAAHHDRMTECVYAEPLRTFETGIVPEAVYEIPLKERGPDALGEIPGISMDEWDRAFYFDYFVNKHGRNPTIVEIMDLNNANSEHSRHGYFRGRQVIDGEALPETLMEIVKSTLTANPANSIIAFKDNSSGITGRDIETIVPAEPGGPSKLTPQRARYHVIFTAETHNFPTGVAPFPGAETGTGGRIRDVQGTGRGGFVVAGTAAYCVANLHIPGYEQPWEAQGLEYPGNLARALAIEIEASDGASDYGNKFGEPLIQGFTRSFDMVLPSGERWAYLKPIMFAGGIGQIDDRHTAKADPERGMRILQIGGPAYRVGFGGGAASSMLQGENVAELDFNAVQRGDAEMEQKMNRVIRACNEMGAGSLIEVIHDQGAGGPGNVLKELVEKTGGRVDIRRIRVGDPTMSVLEIWVAEYQERNGLLVRAENLQRFEAICRREKVGCENLGAVTGDQRFVVEDSRDDSTPEDLDLAEVLGNIPQKTFEDRRIDPKLAPLTLPEGLTVRAALERVLRLLAVGSKRFLTNKVDRSVTGLIARQQCCGPLQATVADVAVIAQSHFGRSGAATAIGEQPVKLLVSPAAGARMAVGEALTNLVFAKVDGIESVKCSGNWMWAPKLPGEGAAVCDAALAMRDAMVALGIAIDGGKDSLSMATRVGQATVKSPRQLVISAYATMADITQVVTPDLKAPGESALLLIDLSQGRMRLGGSALAQVFGQLGSESPDMDDPALVRRAFGAVQELIGRDLVLAGHDVSDGGLVTTLLEMAFSGNCGIDVDLPGGNKSRPYNHEYPGVNDGHPGVNDGRPGVIDGRPGVNDGRPGVNDGRTGVINGRPGVNDGRPGVGEGFIPSFLDANKSAVELLFAEELGLVVECRAADAAVICKKMTRADVPCRLIGRTCKEKTVTIHFNGAEFLAEDMRELRAIWEETSYRLERLQMNPDCAESERKAIHDRTGPTYHVPFAPQPTAPATLASARKPKVAILREEGSNSDREMAGAFHAAGFEPWDVTMTDLLAHRVSLEGFRGLAAVGGFSYADVPESAKGWAATIRFNERLAAMFDSFYGREDTFSLGVCNGCQLFGLLGWVPWRGIAPEVQPRFVHNTSGRFESRWSTVRVLPSRSVLLRGMEGLVFGIPVAHGEGRLIFPDAAIHARVLDEGLAAVAFVDDDCIPTEQYPFNPNGSPGGITALTTPDGRHLAMMPHPERCFIPWQAHWLPEHLRRTLAVSPWLRIFQNAREWCDQPR